MGDGIVWTVGDQGQGIMGFVISAISLHDRQPIPSEWALPLKSKESSNP